MVTAVGLSAGEKLLSSGLISGMTTFTPCTIFNDTELRANSMIVYRTRYLVLQKEYTHIQKVRS